MLEEFNGLSPEVDYLFKAIQLDLPESYQLDYMIYKISESVADEQILWNMPYIDVVRRLLFKQFDSYVLEEYRKQNGKNANN